MPIAELFLAISMQNVLYNANGSFRIGDIAKIEVIKEMVVLFRHFCQVDWFLVISNTFKILREKLLKNITF